MTFYVIARRDDISCVQTAAHYGETKINDSRLEELLEFFAENDLHVLSTRSTPTFFRTRQAGDHKLNKCKCLFYEELNNWRIHEENNLTDHRLITFTFCSARQHPAEINKNIYRLKGASLEDFRNHIHQTVGRYNETAFQSIGFK